MPFKSRSERIPDARACHWQGCNKEAKHIIRHKITTKEGKKKQIGAFGLCDEHCEAFQDYVNKRKSPFVGETVIEDL